MGGHGAFLAEGGRGCEREPPAGILRAAMAGSEPARSDAAAWAGGLVIALTTFWTFVLALVLMWLLERTGVLAGAAFTWGLRITAAAATVAAFLFSPVLAKRAGPRSLAPLAVATGLTLAVTIAFLFVILSVRSG